MKHLFLILTLVFVAPISSVNGISPIFSMPFSKPAFNVQKFIDEKGYKKDGDDLLKALSTVNKNVNALKEKVLSNPN